VQEKHKNRKFYPYDPPEVPLLTGTAIPSHRCITGISLRVSIDMYLWFREVCSAKLLPNLV
jgi:hypothetical protein